MRVLQRGRFRVYVYPEEGEPHHKPHCNVRWSDGDAQVELPTLDPIVGDPLPREARDLIFEGRAALIAAWNLLNPGRRIV